MSIESTLKVTEIQRFCMHDGPGVRTTVFFKGCPLKCSWCHNPETQKFNSELMLYPNKCIGCGICVLACRSGAQTVADKRSIDREKCVGCFACVDACPTGALEKCGREMTVMQIIEAVERDRSFYGENGGITLSGGEPLAQGEKIIELLLACKSRGITTALETCGHVGEEILMKAYPYVDTFLFDVKDTDANRHKQYTGVSNDLILRNLRKLSDAGARIRLRCIIVNGVNTSSDHYERLCEIAKSIKNLDGIDLLPYHAYGGSKAVLIGKEDNGRTDFIPTEDMIKEARSILASEGII